MRRLIFINKFTYFLRIMKFMCITFKIVINAFHRPFYHKKRNY